MNVDILGISELKWTRMGEFNSDDDYIYYCGQESLRRNGVAIMVNKIVRNAHALVCSKPTNRREKGEDMTFERMTQPKDTT